MICSYTTEILFFNIRLFKTEMLLLVNHLQDKPDTKCGHTETGQHDERGSIVELSGIGHTFIGCIEHLSDKKREEPKADILYPEDKCIGGTYHLYIDEFRNAGPQGSRDERERSAENENGEIGNDDAADLIALKFGKDESESDQQ